MTRILSSILKKRNIAKEVRPYLMSITSVLLKILVVLSAIGIVGVETSSFVAILAAAGFAIGMALQGSLGNFAAGILILLFKPYKVGDIIELDDMKGEVIEIQVFNTLLKTITSEIVIVPNSIANSDKIINHTTINHMRVEVYPHIPYNEDFKRVEKAILENIYDLPLIIKSPIASVNITEFDSHSIKIGVFAYCKPYDYYSAYFQLTRYVKQKLGDNDVRVAYSEGVELGAIGKETK